MKWEGGESRRKIGIETIVRIFRIIYLILKFFLFISNREKYIF